MSLCFLLSTVAAASAASKDEVNAEATNLCEVVCDCSSPEKIDCRYELTIFSSNFKGFLQIIFFLRNRGISSLDDVFWSPKKSSSVGERDTEKELDLSRNNLEEIAEGVRWPRNVQKWAVKKRRKNSPVTLLVSLLRLDLSHNQIGELWEDPFESGLGDLRDLNLSGNRLAKISEDLLHNLSSLRSLDLSKNSLDKTDGAWFEGNRELIRLDLSGNPLGANTNWIKNQIVLCTILFSHFTGSVHEFLFSPLPRLLFLDLSDCGLQSLPVDLLANNSALEEVRLSRNPLSEVPQTQLFPAKETLNFLDLSETEIEVSLGRGNRSYSPSLLSLSLLLFPLLLLLLMMFLLLFLLMLLLLLMFLLLLLLWF